MGILNLHVVLNLVGMHMYGRLLNLVPVRVLVCGMAYSRTGVQLSTKFSIGKCRYLARY